MHGDLDEPCVALVPLFSHLSRHQQDEVAGFARPVRVDAGVTLVRAGQPQAQLFVVHEGSVKVTRTTEDGRETTLQVLGRGDVAGETWFLTGERPEHDVVATQPSRMCVFDHAVLADLLRRYPDIGVAMLRTLAARLNSTERMLAARTLADVGARVAAYLLDLPAQWQPDGHATVRLPMAKKDVATYLGTTPETLSRRLAGLERDGLIEVRGAEVDILDAGALDLRSRGV